MNIDPRQTASAKTAASDAPISGTQAIRSYCAQCSSFCAVVYHVDNGQVVKVTPDKDHPNGHGVCVRGAAVPELVHSPHRILYPMKRTRAKGDSDPGWQRISWEEAMETIARNLSDAKREHGPEAVFFNRGAPAGTGAGDYNDWVTRLAHAFGSPNAGATTHICQWHRDGGSKYTYGHAFPEPDYDNTKCIVLWGHNPHVTIHQQRVFIQRAVARGARLVVVDPRPIRFTNKADVWLRVRPGTDGALALSMIKVMLDEELYDENFVRDWTNAPFLVRSDNGRFLRGNDVFADSSTGFVIWDNLSNAPRAYDPAIARAVPGSGAGLLGEYPIRLSNGSSVVCKPAFQLLRELVSGFEPEKMEAVTWCNAADVRKVARLLRRSGPACYMTYNGLEQHTNAMQTNRAICTLYSLTGWLDSPGGNVVFTRTPVNPIVKPGLISRAQFGKILGVLKRPLGAASMGAVQAYAVYEAILTGKPYAIKACIAFGGNMVMANGDSANARAALQQLPFFVQLDFFLTPTAQLADIVLPAANQWETAHVRTHFSLGPATASYCQLRKQIVSPPGECRGDMEVMFDLASRLGLGEHFGNGNIEAAFNEHLKPAGITVEDLARNPGGIHIQVPVNYKKYAAVDSKNGAFVGFGTPSKRVEIYSETFQEKGYDPLPLYLEPAFSPASRPDLARKYPLVLTNAKIVQFNHSQHRSLPSLRKRVPHPYVEINPRTARDLGIGDGDWVYIETMNGKVKMTARFEPKIDARVIATQHGWWQACPELDLPGYDPYSGDGANANLLVKNDVIDIISGSVPHRSYLCNVRKA